MLNKEHAEQGTKNWSQLDSKKWSKSFELFSSHAVCFP